jgi:hypothetical protein
VPLRLLAEWIKRRAEYDLADFRCTGQLFLPKVSLYVRHFRAFSGKVDTGFPQKMRPLKESRALFRFNLIGTRSSVGARSDHEALSHIQVLTHYSRWSAKANLPARNGLWRDRGAFELRQEKRTCAATQQRSSIFQHGRINSNSACWTGTRAYHQAGQSNSSANRTSHRVVA